MAPEQNLDVVIGARVNDLAAGMAEATGIVQDSVRSIRSSLQDIRGAVGAVGLALTGLIASGFAGLREQEDTFTALRVHAQNLGLDFETVKDQVLGLADAWLATAGIGESEMAAVFRTLLGFTGSMDEATALIPVVMDLAAGLGKSPLEAARMLGRAYQGNVKELASLVGGFEKGETEAETFAAVLAKLQELFGGLAEERENTWGVQLAYLKENLKQIGEAIVPMADRVDVLKDINRALADLAKTCKDLPETSKQVLGIGAAFAAAWGGAKLFAGVPVIGELLAGFAGILTGPVGLAIVALGLAWASNFGDMKRIVKEWWDLIRPLFERAVERFKDLMSVQRELVEKSKPWWTLFMELVVGASGVVLYVIGLLLNMLLEVVLAVKNFANNAKAHWKAFSDAAEGAIQTVIGWVERLMGWLSKVTGISIGPSLNIPTIPAMAGAGGYGNVVVNLNGGVYATEDAIDRLTNDISSRIDGAVRAR